jgi:hypothetical protein
MGTLYPGNNPPAPASTSEGGASIVGDTRAPDSPGPFVMSAETLEGDAVVNRANEDLGNVEHIMIDVPSGRIAYAVLACGGVFGIGEKLFAVPWSALTLDADRRCFILDIDKSRLEQAPGFDKDHWPSMADPAWAASIHDYYGVRPYWAERARMQ